MLSSAQKYAKKMSSGATKSVNVALCLGIEWKKMMLIVVIAILKLAKQSITSSCNINPTMVLA
jgi:hypothetical protein